MCCPSCANAPPRRPRRPQQGRPGPCTPLPGRLRQPATPSRRAPLLGRRLVQRLVQHLSRLKHQRRLMCRRRVRQPAATRQARELAAPSLLLVTATAWWAARGPRPRPAQPQAAALGLPGAAASRGLAASSSRRERSRARAIARRAARTSAVGAGGWAAGAAPPAPAAERRGSAATVQPERGGSLP